MTRRGLTALELVLALAITGLAATIGAATLALLGDHRHRLEGMNTSTERAAVVRRTLVEWLEGAHGGSSLASGSPQPAFQLLDVSQRGRAADELLFATTAATPLGTADALVRLYVDGDPRTPERGLVAELAAWPGASTMRIQLDSAVAELEIRCQTDVLGGRRWISSWMSSSLLPRGIELRLRPARGSALDPLLALPILVAVEGGQ